MTQTRIFKIQNWTWIKHIISFKWKKLTRKANKFLKYMIFFVDLFFEFIYWEVQSSFYTIRYMNYMNVYIKKNLQWEIVNMLEFETE